MDVGSWWGRMAEVSLSWPLESADRDLDHPEGSTGAGVVP